MNAPARITPTLAELLEMPVHPLAALFPMLPADELQDLADDIDANGLRHPIVIGQIGEDQVGIIDGRNRLAACKLIDHEPATEWFDGNEAAITALITGENANRRHLTPSQRAMARAFADPEGTPGKRTDLSGNPERLTGQEQNMLSFARAVLRANRQLALDVMGGKLSVEAAFRQIRETANNQSKESIDKERLRVEAPDLYRDVERAGKDVTDAIREHEDRIRKKRERRQRTTGYLQSAMAFLAPLKSTPEEWAETHFSEIDAEFFTAAPLLEMTPSQIRDCASSLAALADLMERDQDDA